MKPNVASLNLELISKCSTELRLKQRFLLKDLLDGERRGQYDKLNKVAGVYAFWWKGENKILKDELKSGRYFLKGPHVYKGEQELIPVNFNLKWIEKSTSRGDICLYVGKSTNIRQRVMGHVRYKTSNIWKDSDLDPWPNLMDKLHGKVKYGFGKKPNSVSQLRIGLERIFNINAQQLIKDHIAISWIELSDDKINNSVNRFFIEDKLISEYYPILNIDIER